MPITSSAKKAHRRSLRRRALNIKRKAVLKTAIKKFKKSTDSEGLSVAYKNIDKAAKVGLIKKNTAARMKSRLSKTISQTS